VQEQEEEEKKEEEAEAEEEGRRRRRRRRWWRWWRRKRRRTRGRSGMVSTRMDAVRRCGAVQYKGPVRRHRARANAHDHGGLWVMV